MKPITIIGAGLAGLALGNALRRAGVAVTLYEAGSLPRHRVCGEFICGRGTEALETLGLQEVLQGAARHQSTVWHLGNQAVYRAMLPRPASGISRFLLDQRLAETFVSQGGRLLLNHRFPTNQPDEGIIYCNGRQATRSAWIGLKCHCTGLQTTADLELHLGKNGYVGLSAIEADRVNVCALFKRAADLKAPRQDLLATYLRASGLQTVAERIASSQIDPNSHAGVAGIRFSQIPPPETETLRLGDAYSVMPPFTGNGMSIALESATLAFPLILDYAQGALSWNDAMQQSTARFHQKFDRRLRTARALHPWLSRSFGQVALAGLSRMHLLPFQLLYRLTH